LQPGDFISFKLTAPLDHLQTCDSIAKIRPPRTVTVIDRDPAPINVSLKLINYTHFSFLKLFKAPYFLLILD